MQLIRISVVLLLGTAVCIFGNQRATVSDLYDAFENGDLDFCLAHLAEVKEHNPNNSNVIYMQGLLETDGERSIASFKEVSSKYKTSSKIPNAQQKEREYNKIVQLLASVKPELPEKTLIPALQIKPIPVIKSIPPAPVDGDRLFYLQLGAYSSQANAEKALQQLSEFQPFLKKAELNGRLLFLILSKTYDSQILVEKAREKAETKHNIKAIIKDF